MTLPFVKGSATSQEAAESVTKKTVVRDRARIVAALKSYGALTDEEIQTRTGLSGNTERPRRVELVRQGVVIATEMQRRTASGRWATAWTLK